MYRNFISYTFWISLVVIIIGYNFDIDFFLEYGFYAFAISFFLVYGAGKADEASRQDKINRFIDRL